MPRYVDYEAYNANFTKDLERPTEVLIDESKIAFSRATMRLKNLIAVEDS